MIVLVASYFGLPGQGDIIASNLERMAGEVKQNEPGCVVYDACRSQDNPDFFLLYEHYVDQSALDGHRLTPHFQEIVEGTIIPLLDRRERVLYTLVGA
jgi:autoinducer 2-degrading protein